MSNNATQNETTPNRVLLYKAPYQLEIHEVIECWDGDMDCYSGQDCSKVMSIRYGDNTEYNKIAALAAGFWLWEGIQVSTEIDPGSYHTGLEGEYRRLSETELRLIALGGNPFELN